MTDPKRLLDDAGTLTSEERQVLAAHARFAAPPDARSRLWSSLTAAVGTAAIAPALSNTAGVGSSMTAGVPAAAGGAASGHALGLGAIVKLTLVGVGIGTSIATASHFWSARESNTKKQVVSSAFSSAVRNSVTESAPFAHTAPIQAPIDSAPTRTVEKQATSAAAKPITDSEPGVEPAVTQMSDNDRAREVTVTNGRAVTTIEPKSERSSANAREESQLVGSARTMLRAGNATVALQLLELATARFPTGVLIQEREALRIEALTALGRTSEARARAESFVRAYPNSPHVSRVRNRK